jgi:hypothetical protein
MSLLIGVDAVVPMDDYQLHLVFSTGEAKIFDMKPYLKRKPFVPLQDKSVFANATLASGDISWCNGEVDIAPETLYEKSQPI